MTGASPAPAPEPIPLCRHEELARREDRLRKLVKQRLVGKQKP
jgi:hypothetical protein